MYAHNCFLKCFLDKDSAICSSAEANIPEINMFASDIECHRHSGMPLLGYVYTEHFVMK